MPTLSQLTIRLESLKAALAQAALTVEHADTRVQYRSVEEIRTAIGIVQEEIEQQTGGGIIRSYKITSSKDL
jgi:hypothetical protein